jgi:tetratricopeptide (TPR) repeat protein
MVFFVFDMERKRYHGVQALIGFAGLRSIARFVAVLAVALPLAAQPALVDRVHAALDRDDPKTAADLLEPAVTQTPDDAQLHYLLGVAYGEMAEKASVFRQPGLARKTRNEFERAVQLDPNLVDARWSLVQYYTLAPRFLGGGDEKAVDQAREIARRNPVYGHRAMAFIDENKKDYQAAMAELDAGLEINPSDMASLFELGYVAANSGINLVRGEQALLKYLARKPGRADAPADRAMYWLGKIYEREGRKDDAERAYEQSRRMGKQQ